MAIQPDLVGTITLTSASTAFTWAGTSLVSASIQAGDEIRLPGKMGVLTIASITSATTGTLTDNCPASAAGAGQVARIRYQSDVSRVAAQMRQLIELLGSGNVSALAALDGAGGDKGFHLTGAGVMATHTLTALGRALAGLTGANGKFPVATGVGSAELRDIVGSVAQSGGVPTGAIVERGSNANGEYVRFADGTQICFVLLTLAYVNSTRLEAQWTFPAAFNLSPKSIVAALPYQTANYMGSASALTNFNIASHQSGTSLTSIAAWVPGGGMSSGAAIANVQATAVGRWI